MSKLSFRYLLYPFGSFLQHLLVVFHVKDGVHLRSQSNILLNGYAVCLIFHLSEDFLVRQAVQWMVLCVSGCVKEIDVLQHVLINVVGLDLVTKAVRVSEQQLCVAVILGFHVLVMKLVHEYFGEI